jgi:bacterioferritin-associated ferredoxin
MRIISIRSHKMLAPAIILGQNTKLNDNDSHYREIGKLVEGASMIVCVCNNISDREIRQAVDLGLSSMDELSRDLGVATCCGQCADCALQVLDQHLAATAAAGMAATELSFRTVQAA